MASTTWITIQIGNHLSWIKGSHNLKFGGELYRISMSRGAANLEEGALGFGANETGNAFASFLLGLPNNTGTPEGLPLTFPRANRIGAYIHDDWKVSPKLTVNLGLRFDYNGFPVDSKGLWRTLTLPGEGADIGRGIGYTKPDGTVIPTVFPGIRGRARRRENGKAGRSLLHAARWHCVPARGRLGHPYRRWLV